MSATDIAALVGAGAAVLLAVAVSLLVVSARRTLNKVDATLTEVHGELVHVLRETRFATQRANSSLAKIDDVLESAHSVGETVDSASRLAYSVFSSPLVKAAGLATGLARGVDVLRRRR